MRLTLRTLLAHLCGLLEPEDARNLDEKIQNSGRGQELAKRIPKLVAKRELDAPRLDSRAAGGDANTVSEYLDGILTPERTAEFDRACLKSDRQLAEVASCFEILSVVHQKPAKVSSSVRQKIYKLGTVRIDDPVQDEQGPQPTERARRAQIPQPADVSELAPHQRAAILEEYVDAPILKPAQKAEQAGSVEASSEPNPVRPPAKRPSDSQVLDVPGDRSGSSETGPSATGSGDNWFADDAENVEMAVGSNTGSKFNIPDVDSISSRRWTTSIEGPSEANDEATDEGLTAEAIDAPPREDEEVAAPPISDADDQAEQPAVQVNLKSDDAEGSANAAAQLGVGRRRRWLPLMAVVVAGVGIALVAFFATGSHNRVLAMFSSEPADSNAAEEGDQEGAADTSTGDSGTDSADGDGPSMIDAETSRTEGGIEEGAGPIRTQDQGIARNPTPDMAAGNDGRSPLIIPTDRSDEESPPYIPSGIVDEPEGTNPTLSDEAGLPNPAQADADQELTMAGEAIGKLLTTDQIIARQIDDSVEGVKPGWYRLAGEAPIYEVDQLLNLPSYRSQFSISDAFLVTLIEASGLELMGLEGDRPRLGLRFGRMTIESNGRASVEAIIDAVSVNGKATFADSDSKISVRVLSYLPPGSDPATTASTSIVDIIAVRGRVVWEDSAKVEVLDAGQSKRYVDGVAEEVVSLTAIPYWVEQGLSGIDLTGSESVAEALSMELPIEDGLLRLSEDSHVEVRMLVAQCLSLLGRHQYCVQALSEDRNKSYWGDQIEWLRGVVARGPAHAESLLETMNFIDTTHGAQAFRLLLGFSPEQVAAGSDKELIDLLESNELMLRVLAIDNLLKITGTRGMFRPETPQRIRENHVRTWRKRLERSEVRYLAPPAPPTVSGNRTGE